MASTINSGCHSMFRVLGIFNFTCNMNWGASCPRNSNIFLASNVCSWDLPFDSATFLGSGIHESPGTKPKEPFIYYVSIFFGPFWTPLDPFGPLWTPLDTFGHLWTPLDIFGHFLDTIWTLFRHFWTLFRIFDPTPSPLQSAYVIYEWYLRMFG